MNSITCRSGVAMIVLLIAGSWTIAESTQPSQLWGLEGEKWSPAGRLTDFSYAGYHRGEKPLPDLKPQVSVAAFGARGDDEADDTQAFQKALAAGKRS